MPKPRCVHLSLTEKQVLIVREALAEATSTEQRYGPAFEALCEKISNALAVLLDPRPKALFLLFLLPSHILD